MNKHLNAIRKAGAGSLFAPTKAMNRVRAIAADPTQSSLTGGCFDPRIIRICTEFCGSEGEAGRPGATGPGSGCFGSPLRVADAGERRVMDRGVAHLRAAIRSRVGTKLKRSASIASRPVDCKCANVKTASRIYRFARRGAHATVKEVLKQAIAASKSLAHNSRRGGAALLIRTSEEFEQPHRVTPG